MKIHGEVDDTVGADTENGQEFQSTIVQSVADKGWTRVGKSTVRHVERVDIVVAITKVNQ